jgi:hypothetical protein
MTVFVDSLFFEKDLKRQGKKDHQILKEIENLKKILEEDSYNFSGKFDIKKLQGIKSGKGQFIHSDINRSKGSHSRPVLQRGKLQRESRKILDSPVSSTGQA